MLLTNKCPHSECKNLDIERSFGLRNNPFFLNNSRLKIIANRKCDQAVLIRAASELSEYAPEEPMIRNVEMH